VPPYFVTTDVLPGPASSCLSCLCPSGSSRSVVVVVSAGFLFFSSIAVRASSHPRFGLGPRCDFLVVVYSWRPRCSPCLSEGMTSGQGWRYSCRLCLLCSGCLVLALRPPPSEGVGGFGCFFVLFVSVVSCSCCVPVWFGWVGGKTRFRPSPLRSSPLVPLLPPPPLPLLSLLLPPPPSSTLRLIPPPPPLPFLSPGKG